jgi:hypothetical protein
MLQEIEEESSKSVLELWRQPVTCHPEDAALGTEDEVCDGYKFGEGSVSLAVSEGAQCPVASETLVVASMSFVTEL